MANNIGYPIEYTATVKDQIVQFTVTGSWDTHLYDGVAYAIDGKVTIRLNDIVRPYLIQHTEPNIDQSGIPIYNYRYTDLTITITGEITGTITHTFDSIYPVQTYTDEEQLFLSAPISNKYDSREYLFVSYYQDENMTLNDDELIADDFANTYSLQSTGNLHFKSDYTEFWYYPSCGDYAIYYINEYGGWDSLLVKANKSESKTNYDYKSDNTTNRYKTEFTNSYKVYSDYVINNDNIHHLLNSTCVYMHSLSDDKIFPVIIDSSSYEFKKRFGRLELTLKDAHTYERW